MASVFASALPNQLSGPHCLESGNAARPLPSAPTARLHALRRDLLLGAWQPHGLSQRHLSALRAGSRAHPKGQRAGTCCATLIPQKVVDKAQEAAENAPFGLSDLLDVTKIDSVKQKDMVYRRVVFGVDDWRKHRSSGRHLRHIQSIPGSRVIRSLAPVVFFMTAFASLVDVWNIAATNNFILPKEALLHLSPLPFSLTAPALAFLLVFRTNSSYGRFDEARKMWGGVLNRLRDTARLAITYMGRDEHSHQKEKVVQFCRFLQAFPITLKHHLVPEGSIEEDLRNLTLSEDELAGIVAARHRPLYCLQIMTEISRKCEYAPAQRLSIDQSLGVFEDLIGGCERILRTPIPLSYTRLTSRFLILWHCILPLGLWDACGVLTPGAVASSAAVLFCVDEVGVVIEEPFSLLALTAIGNTARRDIDELLERLDGIERLIVPDAGEPGVALKGLPKYAGSQWPPK